MYNKYLIIGAIIVAIQYEKLIKQFRDGQNSPCGEISDDPHGTEPPP